MTAAGPLRRVRGAAGDLILVGAWATVAAVVGVLLRALGLAPTTVGGWDGVAAVTLVVPVALTHAVLEAGSTGATPGKHRAGVRVVTGAGAVPGLATTTVRALVKFAPWQLGHSAAFRLVAGSESPVWLVMASGAQLLVVASFVLMVARRDRRALHDLVAGTRVVLTRAVGASGSG